MDTDTESDGWNLHSSINNWQWINGKWFRKYRSNCHALHSFHANLMKSREKKCFHLDFIMEYKNVGGFYPKKYPLIYWVSTSSFKHVCPHWEYHATIHLMKCIPKWSNDKIHINYFEMNKMKAEWIISKFVRNNYK